MPDLFRRSHSQSIGSIERSNPWRETTWRLGPRQAPWAYVVRWESPATAPRWTWRLHRHQACLLLQYGGLARARPQLTHVDQPYHHPMSSRLSDTRHSWTLRLGTLQFQLRHGRQLPEAPPGYWEQYA